MEDRQEFVEFHVVRRNPPWRKLHAVLCGNGEMGAGLRCRARSNQTRRSRSTPQLTRMICDLASGKEPLEAPSVFFVRTNELRVLS